MAKIKSKVRRLRMQREAAEERRIPIQEVADRLGIDRKRLTQLELGRQSEIRMSELAELCKFYGVDVGELLEFDPEGIRTPGLVAA